MRAPADLPINRRRSGRGRVVLFVALVVGFLLLTSVRGVATFVTDRMWFDSTGFVETFDTIVWARVGLGLGFTLLFAVLLWVDLSVAHGLSQMFRPASPEDEFLARYQDLVERRSQVVRIGVALGFGVITGAGMAARWNEYLLWANGRPFGQTDATYGLDIGFYVFDLPFYVVLADWAFASLVIMTLVTLGAYYLNGGIRLQAPSQRITPQVKAHLSFLLAMLALVKGVQYLLERYLLVYSNRSGIQAAGYTAVHVDEPALRLLALIALTAAVLLLVNVRRRGWVLPVVVVVLWAVVQLAAGSILPAAVQKWVVDPSQSTREAEYVAENIDATRQSYDLVLDDQLQLTPFDYDGSDDVGETRAALEANPETVRNIRLLDPEQVRSSFQKLQRQNQSYTFTDIDVDRYPLRLDEDTSASTAMLIGTRDLDRNGIPNPTWENLHIAYTHGYGVALAAANAVVGDGDPDFVVSNVPTEYSDAFEGRLDQPYVYYGNIAPTADDYVIVGASRDEIGYIEAGTEQTVVPNRYEGDGGVPIGSSFNQALFALRFADWNLFVSSFVGPDSQLLMHRDVANRVQSLAPLDGLVWDTDPYPVLVNGRIQFIVDGYTITDRYPNAQSLADVPGANMSRVVPERSGLNTDFNYVRNSVKAVVDAYDGTVNYYIWDEDDPILATYGAAFPDLFRPRSQMHSELQAHVRFPEDLFKVQTSLLATYHISDPSAFLQKSGAWSVANDPGSAPPKKDASGSQTVVSDTPIEPYYVLMNLPGEDQPEFVLIRPFVPVSGGSESTQKLTAFAVARTDGEHYGEIVVYQMPSPFSLDGPTLVNSSINNNETISEQITLLGQGGSNVTFGNMVLVPVNNSLLWVRPMYVTSDQFAQLKQVIVAWGTEIVMKPTLREALEELFGATEVQTLERPDSGDPTGQPQTDGGSPTGAEGLDRVAELLDEATALKQQADEALAGGKGLGEYQRLIDESNAKVAEAQQLLEDTSGTPGTAGTTTTSASVPPT